MADPVRDAIGPANVVNSGDFNLQPTPTDAFTLQESLRNDEVYSTLKDFFLKSGRGRRPNLPNLNPTNRILLQLYFMKEETSSSWEVVADWYARLFPETDVSRGKLEYKVKTTLKAACDSKDILDSITEWIIFPDELLELGLSRDILLGNGDCEISFRPESVTNSTLSALENFRSKEGLPQSFVYNWLSKFCQSSVSQMRHKATNTLKKIKDLKRKKKVEDLEKLLSASILNSNEVDSTLNDNNNMLENKRVLNSSNSKCKSCKELKSVQAQLQSLKEQNESLKLETTILKEERDKLKKFESSFQSLQAYKKRVKELDDMIKTLHRTSLYNRNRLLRRQLAKSNDENTKLNIKINENCDKIVELKLIVKSLKGQIKKEQTLKSNLKKRFSEKKEEADAIKKFINSPSNIDNFSTREDRGNKFSNEMRLSLMQLQGEANVSAKNCSKVVQIVSKNLFGKDLVKEELPSTSTALNVADEAHFIAKKHIGEEMSKSKYFIMGSDGTSRQKRHYMERHIQLQNGKMLSMGYTEIASDDSKTLLEQMIEVLDEISEIYSSSEEEKDKIFKEILIKMQCLMSDRAANMKLFNKLLHQYKKDTLNTDVSTHFLYCNAHFLLGAASATDEALKDIEKTKGKLGRDKDGTFFKTSGETAVQRLIRSSADALGPRGDERSGCREKWLGQCDILQLKSALTSFRGNRFNNLFENADALIFHRKHIPDFLTTIEQSNFKLKGILNDITDEILLSIVAAVALFGSLFTTPYWNLMNSQTSYGQFPPYVKALDSLLFEWSSIQDLKDASHHQIFDEFKKSAAVVKFIESPDCHTEIALETFKHISEKVRIVLRRQLADFLDDGIFSKDVPQDVQNILNTCPLTNLVGERLFGDLDYDMKKRYRASTHHRSTLSMWKHNKISSWLAKKSPANKTKILAEAAKKKAMLREKHKQSEARVRERIKAKIKEDDMKRKERNLKDGRMKASVLDQIIASGGVCTTKEELDQIYKKGKVEDLRAQIRYRRMFLGEKNLKLAGSSKRILYDRLLEQIGQQ